MHKVLTQIHVAPNCDQQFQDMLSAYLASCGHLAEGYRDPATSGRFVLCETFLTEHAAQTYHSTTAVSNWHADLVPFTTAITVLAPIHTDARPVPLAKPSDSFELNHDGLATAISMMTTPPRSQPVSVLPDRLPTRSIGDEGALATLAGIVLGNAARLGGPTSLAHMDPPTPWITWATTMWNASLNQNLLHPDTAPAARDIEKRVIDWLVPLFGMDGGHMVPGSTLANLTALWAARDLTGATCVVASETAHLSIAKSAHLLGMRFVPVPTLPDGRIDPTALPDSVSDSVLVLTAGATSTGAIDDLSIMKRAKWCHVDAAWAGPLVLSKRYKSRLSGIENAHSIAISAHKWFFQPKESALVLFRSTAKAHAALIFGGAYLATPNIGILGSHGATAVPLLATLLAWGRDGMASHIDTAMTTIETLFTQLTADKRTQCFGPPTTGVLLWKPTQADFETVRLHLPPGLASVTKVEDQDWFRQVAANPLAQVALIWDAIDRALETQ